ncbi:MAG TPA: thioredoxin fold domain-containing protein [Gammaproteobacteria bacterium]|nr:thioredoxin fold domain-containing protein [Gammaproteobacteria bacterium]
MKRRGGPFRIAVLLPLGLALGAAPALADPPQGYDFLPYDQGLKQARAEHKKVLLYFGRYGCGFCQKTNEETFSDPELKRRLTDHYVLVYADAEGADRLTLPSGERITERELGSRLNAFATPLFVFLSAAGKVLFRAPGYKTVKQFERMDRYIHSGAYRHESYSKFAKGAQS